MAVLIVAMLALIAPLAVVFDSSPGSQDMTLGATVTGHGTEADPYVFSAIAGEQYSYTMSVKNDVPVTYSITSGDISKIGLTLNENIISGTAVAGKEKVCITATSNDGGPNRFGQQWIQYNFYTQLSLTGSVTPTSWAGTAYETTFTVSNVDPDVTTETTLTLNQAATDANFVLTKVSETSYKLTRTAENNVVGTVEVVVTATSTTSGIVQTKSASATVSTYDNVGITSMPPANEGEGLTVWLIEDQGNSWTYTPTATPDSATITASGLNDHMTFTNGVLTVDKSVIFDSTNVTITASSNAGGSTQTATQVLAIKNWSKIEFNSSPSVSDIKVQVNQRTVHASVQAANYSNIMWTMSDGTTYEGVTEIDHTFEDAGAKDIAVTVSDEIGREKTSRTSVVLSNEENPNPDNPTPAPGGDEQTKKDLVQFAKDNWLAVLGLILGIFLLLYGICFADDKEPFIAVGIILIVVAAVVLYADYQSIDVIQEIKDWFSGVKDWFSGLFGGSKDAA